MGSRPPPPMEGEGQLKGKGATIFVSDPSAEVERVAKALRAAGYNVVDVPLSMLVARVAVQRPHVVLVDSDTSGAVEAITRLRELPDGEGIEVIFIGRSTPGEGTDLALTAEASAFFPRPVEVASLIEKIEALTASTPAVALESGGALTTGSIPPPSLPASVRAVLPPPSIRAERPSQPPPAVASSPRISQVPAPASNPATPGTRRGQQQGLMSTELRELLQEAEDRVSVPKAHGSTPPTPEEEIEAVLPEEVLAALDEPLEEADDDMDVDPGNAGSQARTTSGGGSKMTTGMRTGVAQSGGEPTTSAKTSAAGPAPTSPRGATTPPTEAPEPEAAISAVESALPAAALGVTSAQGGEARSIPPFGTAPPPAAPPTNERRLSSRPPPTAYGPPQSTYSTTLGSEALAASLGIDRLRPSLEESPGAPPVEPSRRAESVPAPVVLPSVLGMRDAPEALATAIAGRVTGTLCFASKEGVRRAVLREGDLVTAASGVDGESLIAFLVARGDLPRERLEQLGGRFAAYGRHAGAALVAHGHLRQDQLWTVLRGHAEWILARAMVMGDGTLSVEHEPPGRLRGEPSVFGGSTGAEVFVEVVRRVIPPDEALARLGGPSAFLGAGGHEALLTECALGAAEVSLLEEARGRSLEEALSGVHDTDMASVLYALSLLGVVSIARRTEAPVPLPVPREAVDADALDSDAVRARVLARSALVDEGDYFAVLGVARDATGYEIRRAFLDLRRTFDPSRLLTPETLDLAQEVRRIVTILEEAYEILRDGARRERYRRAIEASPEA